MTASFGQSSAILHSFWTFTTGADPEAALVLGTDGNLYGTTLSGGTNGGNGTVFKMTSKGKLTSLYSFKRNGDGFGPTCLVQGSDGALYGATPKSGAQGYGALFKLTTTGAFSPIYAFRNDLDGANPSVLATGRDGNIYGATAGTVFKLTPGGLVERLTSTVSVNSLLQAGDGYLYGSTLGTVDLKNHGSVFKLSTTGVLTELYTFSGGRDGGAPNGITMAWDGNFYGTTQYGGAIPPGSGTLFQTTPSGLFRSLYSFTNGIDSANYLWPICLGPDGNLYGLDRTFFRAKPSGAFTVLATNGAGTFNFGPLTAGPDGALFCARPWEGHAYPAGAVEPAAVTAVKADSSSDQTPEFTKGYILRAALNGQISTLFTFESIQDGGRPAGSLVVGVDGSFFGVTSNPGTETDTIGAVFKSDSTGRFEVVYPISQGFTATSFTLAKGIDGTLYGTEFRNGDGLFILGGYLFKITPDGHYIDSDALADVQSGDDPAAPLVQGADMCLYGSAVFGGAGGYGTIFKTTTNFDATPLYSFTNDLDGSHPGTALIQGADGFLYGTVPLGGAHDDGTIFKVSTNGDFTLLYTFTNGLDGANPSTCLAFGDDGNFYGTSYYGGASNRGTVFRMSPDGAFTTLHVFKGADGASPQGTLVTGPDGNVFGVAPIGGAHGFGAVWVVNTNGQFATLYSFPGGNGGAGPNAIAVGNDGKLYGTTYSGGAGGNGTFFKLIIPYAPAMTKQPPASVSQASGSVLTLGASAEGMIPLRYQWQCNGTNLSNSRSISGATSNVLTINPVTIGGAGTPLPAVAARSEIAPNQFRLIVSNHYGAITSAASAVVIVSDTNPPTVSISVPATNGRTYNNLISGAAKDNSRVAAVNYWITNVNNGAVITASGQAALGASLTNPTWSVSGAALPGTNFLTVQSVDFSGNISLPARRKFFLAVPTRFSLTHTGSGSISGAASVPGGVPPTNNALLNIGETYTLAANAATNWSLVNWTTPDGSVLGYDPALRFYMESGVAIQAHFATNSFAKLAGTYKGLFYQSNNVTVETAGAFDVLVAKTGYFFASLEVEGGGCGFSGFLDASGHAQTLISRPPGFNCDITVEMTVDAAENQITGSVFGTNDAPWTSDLLAVLPGHYRGFDQYTLVLPPNTADTNSPPGYDYLIIKNNAGVATITGEVANEDITVPVDVHGNVPLYVDVSPTFLFGWINVASNPPAANLTWIRQPWVRQYPDGFTNTVTAIGSRWIAPLAPINSQPLILTLSGGGLPSNLDYTILFTNDISLADISRMRILATPPGDAHHFQSGDIHRDTGEINFGFRGLSGGAIWLQNAGCAVGSFRGLNNAFGAVTIRKQLVLPQPLNVP